MLALLVLLVIVAPIPVVPLLFAFQPIVIAVRFLPLFQPPPISTILAIVPVVVVTMVAVVVALIIPITVIPVTMFFLLLT
jgi:hypothetical protein